MPAVLTAHRVRLHREYKVLMNSRVLPPNTLRIRIVTHKRTDSAYLAHFPLARRYLPQVYDSSCPLRPSRLLAKPPTSQVVRTGDDARPNPLRHPHFVDEVPDCAVNLEHVSGSYFEPLCVFRMNPDRILV